MSWAKLQAALSHMLMATGYTHHPEFVPNSKILSKQEHTTSFLHGHEKPTRFGVTTCTLNTITNKKKKTKQTSKKAKGHS